MSTSTTPTNAAVQVSSTRQQLINAFDRETATTQKVLRAYPADQAELKPHPRLRSARELAWMFAAELNLANLVLRNEFKMPMKFPPTPATWDEVVRAFDRTRTEVLQNLHSVREEQLAEITQFITGPKQIGDMTKTSLLWFLLHDQIHHRGQLTVYLRMADGKVPSIYGPSADEPWN
ncbi:MAG TPA: DinB family protein [Gemmatimonadaceae bacterium]|nr:DinB family protein [Gemmatimonadaceae bacterium]